MMWIDSENINISISVAILITGGSGAEQSAEVFRPWSNTTCQLPSLPDKRWGHAQAGQLLCGGSSSSTQRSCLKWNLQGGGWTTLPTLSEEYWGSSIWDHGDQLVIMVGEDIAALKSSETSRSFRVKYSTR